MTEFDETWRSAVRFRRVTRELEPLLRTLHAAMRAADLFALRSSLLALLELLVSPAGRTDANCTTTFHFITATESEWESLPGEFRAVLDDMGGALHETIYAPDIARTFEATPEQLLERVKKISTSTSG
jgi:hypothetical protein